MGARQRRRGPYADQPHIFERFVRGSSGERRSGSGLGLAIVARIAEAHGGAAGVDSRPGHGATFTLDLPILPAKDPR